MEVEKSSRPIIGNICRVRQIRFSNLNDFSVRCLYFLQSLNVPKDFIWYRLSTVWTNEVFSFVYIYIYTSVSLNKYNDTVYVQ